MANINIGDTVRYLNAVGGGKVVRIEGNTAWVDDEGFETPVLTRECVVVRTAQQDKETAAATKSTAAAQRVETVAAVNTSTSAAKSQPATKAIDTTENIDTTETAGGDTLNITMAIEPVDSRKMSDTDFDASLVNDSNYYINFVLSTREKDEDLWTLRYAGTVEPNTELWLGTYGRNELAKFDYIDFQFITYKKERSYKIHPDARATVKVDTTRFYKLHCYKPNIYFDNDVIAFNLVENDRVAGSKNEDEVKETIAVKEERRPQRRAVRKAMPAKRKYHAPADASQPLVVDLHITELLDNTRGMSPADILNYQVDTFQQVMNENLRNYGRKIIFIHGKGEGVLRQAITKELNHRYKGHDVQDASFQEYGYGATQVTIRQNTKRHNP